MQLSIIQEESSHWDWIMGVDTLILEFQPLKLREVNVCGVRPLVCGTLLWQPGLTDAGAITG